MIDGKYRSSQKTRYKNLALLRYVQQVAPLLLCRYLQEGRLNCKKRKKKKNKNCPQSGEAGKPGYPKFLFLQMMY